MFSQPDFKDHAPPIINYWRLAWISLVLILAALAVNVAAYASPPGSNGDPMQDEQSREIRDDFAKCREVDNPMSQFFCNCRVLEKQCEAPRHTEHGQWNTVEYWPTENEADREVQFILFMNYDILGGFSPVDTGLVLTCLGGNSDFNIFVGEDVDPDSKPRVEIGDDIFDAGFEHVEGDWIVGFEDNPQIFKALSESDEMGVTYRDLEDNERSLEFATAGFNAVTKGWEPVCERPSS